MDIEDFKYNKKYKFFVPGLFIMSWTLIFVGPFTIPLLYQQFCLLLLIHLTIKSIGILTMSIIGFSKALKIFRKAEEIKAEHREGKNSFNPEVYHAFIIPSYKEDEDLLAETIGKLATHQGACERYMVFLAMEGHEEGSDRKAEKLIKKFEGKFLLVGFTRHQIRKYEQKGKASNVSWCVEHLEELFFEKYKIPAEKVLLTIIDADSWVPEVYVREVNDHLHDERHLAQREYFIYQPNQIFTRNIREVPIVTRVYDQVHGGMHSNNHFSLFDVTFPLSNYSLHFSLAKKIGWWDTCSDAIGEDFHMT